MENQEDAGAKLTEYTGKVPDPRPGSVSSAALPSPLTLACLS